MTRSSRFPCGLLISALSVLLLAGCESGPARSTGTAPAAPSTPGAPVAPSVSVAPAAPVQPAVAVTPAATAVAAAVPVRIRAGATAPFTDSAGNVWLPDQGFADGETIDRASDLPIANTKDPAIYRTERYSMTSFSRKLPNGKYTVKLHFAETFEEITDKGQRVFSFNVEGHDFMDFDVFAKSGGAQRAYLETVNVDVTDGSLDIKFTSNIQNPEINGIEILPGS